MFCFKSFNVALLIVKLIVEILVTNSQKCQHLRIVRCLRIHSAIVWIGLCKLLLIALELRHNIVNEVAATLANHTL